MARHIPFDHLHLTFLVPQDLDAAACKAVQRVLGSKRFRASLRRTFRRVIGQYPALASVRVKITG